MTYRIVKAEADPLGQFKRVAQQAAKTTTNWLTYHGLTGLDRSRAGSAFAFLNERPLSTNRLRWALTHEGLGTKSLVADRMKQLTGQCFYAWIAQDTLAAGLNDCLTGNVLPVLTTMHLAVSDIAWFSDQERMEALITGWVNTCNIAKCAWGGGETPILKDVILPEAAELSCSVLGVGETAWGQLGWKAVEDGDAIVVITTTGIHTNGLTQARALAETLPKGYVTEIGDGRTFGAALLEPTPIYAPFLEDCFHKGGDLEVCYLTNLTGGGWRKLMREPGAYACVIETLPNIPPLHCFMQELGGMSNEAAYGTYNMGGGYALFVGVSSVEQIVELAAQHNLTAIKVGYVDKKVGNRNPNIKQVVMQPLHFSWEAYSV